MKYILTIIIIVLASTVLTLFFLRPDDTPPVEEIILTVNDHNFSLESIKNNVQINSYSFHSETVADLLESMITRELLIQEAQRLGIDQEESFRIALKNYYEQSLIKILTDRKYNSLQTAISEQDVDNYISNFGKIFTFSTLPALTKNGVGEQRHSMLFDDLSDSLGVLLAGMNPGDTKEQFDTSSSPGRIRLEHIEPAPDYQPVERDRQYIRALLIQNTKEELIRSWISGLRDKASIKMYQEADTHEQ